MTVVFDVLIYTGGICDVTPVILIEQIRSTITILVIIKIKFKYSKA